MKQSDGNFYPTREGVALNIAEVRRLFALKSAINNAVARNDEKGASEIRVRLSDGDSKTSGHFLHVGAYDGAIIVHICKCYVNRDGEM